MQALVIALRASLVTLLLTCGAYPLVVTGVSQLVFPAQANGSLVTDARGNVVGSSLIGQSFTQPGYLQPRLSAAGDGYDAMNSGGSNLGPTSVKLSARVKADVERLRAQNPSAEGELPDALVTTSASGLDPHVPPAAALWQVPRIAAARGVSAERVRAVIESHVEERDLWVLGEPRVNVLAVNLALDAKFGVPVAVPDAAPKP